MLAKEIKESPHGSFKVTQLCQSVAICEAVKGDRLGWGNEAEIKIRRMQREADTYAFGLDYLLESEEAKHFGCDFDQYRYDITGIMQSR